MNDRKRALWLTARPKTLSAAIVPVIVATGLVQANGHEVLWWVSCVAILSAICIQIGTNFVNDALDFIKGADRETRLGDARASQSGWFTAQSVLVMGIGFFVLAIVFGIPLVMQGGWPIVIIGLLSVVMGYAYTGGPFPLAYRGLGDLFVIIFFGLIAVGGTYYLHTGQLGEDAVIAGLQIGFLATVLIAINNLRDLDQDKLVNKKTLAVRLGPKKGRLEVLLLMGLAFLLNLHWLSKSWWLASLLPFLISPLAFKVAVKIWRESASREFNALLAKSALIHMAFGSLLTIGLFLV